MLVGLLVVTGGALVVALALGWLVARIWAGLPVLAAAALLALAAGGGLLVVGDLDFRGSMQAAILGCAGLAAAAGLALGALIGGGGRRHDA